MVLVRNDCGNYLQILAGELPRSFVARLRQSVEVQISAAGVELPIEAALSCA